MSSLIAALQGLGIEVGVEDNVLVLKQGQTEFNTSLALRSFSAKPEVAEFFVQEGAHPRQWTREKTLKYLATHSEAEYRALLQAPALEAGVKTLDPNMSRADYLNLTRSEKIAFLREYGSDAAARIMGKKS
jgi:hypothetical protein